MFCKGCKALLKDEYAFCPVCGKATKPIARKKKSRPKGSGCVHKLSGNRAYPFEARKGNVSLGTFKTEYEASCFLIQYQDKRITDTKNITLAELWIMYQTTESYIKLSRDAKNNYNAAWEKSTSGRKSETGKIEKDTIKRLSVFADRKVRDLNGLDYQKVIDGIKAEGLGRDSCEKVRSLISVLCQHAILMQVIDQNYANTLKLPAQGARTKRRNFNYDEILTLFYNDQHRDARILLCLIYSGVREDELFKMRKEEVYLSPERNYMTGGSKTEAGRDRIIPIRSEIIEYITDFYNAGDGPYLIPDDNGQRLNRSSYIKKHFYPLLDKLKFDYKDENGDSLLVPYRSRHTFIAENIKAGVKPEVLTKLVGHANYSTSVNKYDEFIDIDYIIKEAQKGL